MSTGRLVILGGGEHAAVVIDAALTRPDAWEVAGYRAPEASPSLAARFPWLRWLGTDEDAGPGTDRTDPALLLGFGGGMRPAERASAVARFPDATWATIVHAGAWVSPSATLGPGAFVGAGAVVQSGAALGAHVIVNTGAIVEHDVQIGEYSHLAPAAVVGGAAWIGGGVFVGLGARVRDRVRVGEEAVVGMGAVVVEDVPRATTVAGVPARLLPSTAGSSGADRGDTPGA